MSLSENSNAKLYFEQMFGREIQLPPEINLLFSTMILDLSLITKRVSELPANVASRFQHGLDQLTGEISSVREALLAQGSAEGMVKEFGLPESAMAVPVYLILLKILDKYEAMTMNSLAKMEVAIMTLKSFFDVMTTVLFDLEIQKLIRVENEEKTAIGTLRSDSLTQDSSKQYVIDAVRAGVSKMETKINLSRARKSYLLNQKKKWETWVSSLFSGGRSVMRVQKEVVLYSAT